MILERIDGPADLKGLGLTELERLADEIRTVILDTVSRNGGHLAPCLGVVELTLALHTVLESPRDKIIWDVGHQAYAHKLITGRRERFHTLRKSGGISGFPRRAESEHDHFGTAHASTSISAALGMAKARDLRGEKHAVVAVIGDGALTGGMAFEALDHAGHVKTDLIVVLNDNRMSIAPNVGAISNYLTRLRTGHAYNRVKADIEEALRRIPRIGSRVATALERFKDSVKHLIVPGQLFEDLGFNYYGPIDGHDLPLLQDTLRSAREKGGPVLVHVLTHKGRGYAYAEEAPDKWHGPSPFDIATGAMAKSTAPTYSDVFADALIRLARDDRRIVGVTAAMPDGTKLGKFGQAFPDRFFDVGIAEQHATTFCAGLATQGLRPVFAVYSTFLQRALDQVIHDVCIQNLPVVFAIDRAGLVGDDGETHQGVFDFAYLRGVPNITLMAPKDEAELCHMLAAALAHPGPIALRYPRGKGPGAPLPKGFSPSPIGKGEIVYRPPAPVAYRPVRARRMLGAAKARSGAYREVREHRSEGRDDADGRPSPAACVLAIGTMVHESVQAAQALEREGIPVVVANARFCKPLDELLIDELVATGAPLITVEEHVAAAGFGAAVLEYLARQGRHDVQATVLGVPDQFIPHGALAEVRARLGLDAAGIAAVIRAAAGRRPAASPVPMEGRP